MSESAPVRKLAARFAKLEPDPLDPGQVLDGEPRTSTLVLSSSPDGQETGVWRCTPGTFTDVEAAESFVVIEGRATIAFEGGEVEVGPGDVCELAASAETTWTVHETLLKGYRFGPSS